MNTVQIVTCCCENQIHSTSAAKNFTDALQLRAYTNYCSALAKYQTIEQEIFMTTITVGVAVTIGLVLTLGLGVLK